MRNRTIFQIVKNYIDSHSLTSEAIASLTADDMGLDLSQAESWRRWQASILRLLEKDLAEKEFEADVLFIAAQLRGGEHDRNAVDNRFASKGGFEVEPIKRDGRLGTIIWHDGGGE